MEDKQIIDLLFARDEQGLHMTENKYSPFYKGILSRALSDRTDVDECANDVLMALWNSIPPNYPNHFPSYIGRIARRIAINRYKHNTRQKRTGCTVLLSELEGCIPAANRIEEKQNALQLQQVLNAFLLELDSKTRVLFIRRYVYLESVGDLAERFAVSKNYVSVRLYRARVQLKEMLEKEGIAI